MPRELSEVLHYFLSDPESEPSLDTARLSEPDGAADRGVPAALPVVAVAIGDSDVVRAAFTWNLSVEVARLGGRAIVVTPAQDQQSTLWPVAGPGPLGAELVVSRAQGLGELHRAALDIAVDRAADVDPDVGGVVLVRIPPVWVRQAAAGVALLRWTLLYTSGESRDLLETYGIAKLLMAANPTASIGITVHGVRRIEEARRAFTRLSRSTERHLGRTLNSYGMLVDDLHVFRAIVAQRPIGLEHPQCPAARALRDVARIVLDDARERALA